MDNWVLVYSKKLSIQGNVHTSTKIYCKKRETKTEERIRLVLAARVNNIYMKSENMIFTW